MTDIRRVQSIRCLSYGEPRRTQDNIRSTGTSGDKFTNQGLVDGPQQVGALA